MSNTSLEKAKIKILLLEGVHQSAIEALNAAGYENIEYHKTALPEDELIEKISEAHFIGIRSRTQLTAKVLEHANKLVAIGCFCIGTNQVDLEAASSKGIVVFNAPYSNTRSVAELVLGELILLLRGIPEKNAVSHRGGWMKSAVGSFETRGKRLGIVGYGSIGTQLSVLAESLGMEVCFYDIITKLPLGNARQVKSLEELLSTCDVISLHVPETPSTKMMIGAEEIAQIKKGAIFLNASRGTVVDLEALAESIKAGNIAGAAIDVFPVEPKGNAEEFVSPLRGLDNVILTPHIGGSTMEAQENIGVEVAVKLIQYSDIGTTTAAVNFPEVALPAQADTHRILHIHENRPGVLSKINSIFSDNGINISGQFLRTTEKLGYMVMEVDADMGEIALEKVKEVDGTIKARVLF
ncbi:MAG: phosphoglycerate dehydrogenase [Marinomonas sp.]|uniref:D-3-phosphoglycerate dehydrogenase n=1 Tax=Marinomonas communis TaxID=28254 RepID=A0A4R6X5M4_9GAMM|nr:phosphoglycerate dehydrogenase [Marinomonas communis]MAF17135.1 phosphoglycerate dehydrogenase [Marinomonas sp.]MCC4274430.1 phosphoglycerate dehydrogenase [Marinomonas communis]RUM51336.1 MAG: phosphoglycerate dehydrogenase [Marinomonas sp.]RUM57016.1 MAG: phosphoglycerate dehydrogenase [Marinomonas sp.]TDR14292.1 D-3-phosphoglycerate dehydrogenase [Marinomonas communis]